jgi:hypothetical protein
MPHLPNVPGFNLPTRFCTRLKSRFPLFNRLHAHDFRKPPDFSTSSAKVISERPFPSRKTGFLRAPHQWTPDILRNHSGKKVAAQKKLT